VCLCSTCNKRVLTHLSVKPVELSHEIPIPQIIEYSLYWVTHFRYIVIDDVQLDLPSTVTNNCLYEIICEWN